MNSKICFIGNHPSHYRGPIFKLMDETFNIEWHFLEQKTSIKSLDISVLKNAVKEKAWFSKAQTWYFQHNVINTYNRKDIDIFLFVGEPYSISSWILARLIKLFSPSKRIYFWTHGWYGKESSLRKIIKKLFFAPADGIFLYGNYAKKLMIAEGFQAEKLHVIHNSLDHKKQLAIRAHNLKSNEFVEHFGNNCINLIFIGRLTPIKCLDLLLEAVKELNAVTSKYNLTIIGDGSESNFLKQKASELGIDKNVWFYGACYDELKNARLIYNSDICISPGNVGLTAMHTMVYGTPVITHNDLSWQMPEFEAIIPGKTGNFFRRNDVKSLVDSITDWFAQNGNKREEIRYNCYKEIDSNWTREFQIDIFKSHLL